MEIFNLEVSNSFDAPYDEQLVFRTIVTDTEGGKEYRYQKWLYPKRVFTISLDARNRSEMGDLFNFYLRHSGNFDSFLFESPNDSSASYPVTNDTFATGDAVTTVFYVGNKFLLPTGDCYLIDPVTISMDNSGDGSFAVQTEGVDYTLDRTLGQVTMTVTPQDGDVLRADQYRFYYKVRFQDAKLSRRAFAFQLWESGIDMVQVI